jgi:nucleoside 2-deoxyribosyltransferase
MFVFIVAPHSFDPRFEKKVRVLSEVAGEVGVKIGWVSPESVKDASAESIGIGDLGRADAVIGDLSFERPSCYFEIGLAHGMNKPVFLIAEQGTTLHQVVGRDAVEFYSDMAEYREVVRKALSRAGPSLTSGSTSSA